MGFVSLSVDKVKETANTLGRKEDCESTPLLVSKEASMASYPAAFWHQQLPSKQTNGSSSFRNLWKWLSNPFVILTLLTLFCGGILAIVAHIGGKFNRAFLSQVCLSTHSPQPQRASTFAYCNLSDSSLRDCCS